MQRPASCPPWETNFATFLDFLAPQANLSCLRLYTTDALTMPDRTNRSHAEDFASRRLDFAPRCLQHRQRKARDGNGRCVAKNRAPDRDRGGRLRLNPGCPRWSLDDNPTVQLRR